MSAELGAVPIGRCWRWLRLSVLVLGLSSCQERGIDAEDGGLAVATDRAEDSSCTAGHDCRPGSRCQRACFGELAYRCSCAEGRFVCTGCMPVDGGAGDAPGFERCLGGGASVQGGSCVRAGAVCQYAPEAGVVRLCVCGDVGADRLWICQ
jgi:hypothetical protein